ncbi:hypothetical protein BGX38DRAFT_340189 [Terfezia claveryi]|nr:hypothetical protein BGX38DRAFT_340189 [Terfezia claveryi]
MHRRFQSPEFTSFFQALRSLSTTDIETFVASHIRSNKITTLTTKSEAHEGLVPDILYFSGFVSPEINCPHLWEQYEHHGTRADVVYTAKLASEFHQLLIYGLEKAAAAVAAFTNAYKIGSLPAHDDFLLTEVEDWMGYIHVMVHESAIFKVHVEALDREITGRMVQTLPLSNQAAPLQMRVQLSDSETKPLDANIRPFMQEDEDFDGSLSDTAIEISAAQAVSRAGQQSLWLAVSFQHAIRSLCQKQALPKRPLSLTLFNPPVANIPSTLMESWKSVIASLFPAATDDISSATGSETTESFNITAVEVIETLEAYGNDHGGKSTLFLPGRELAIKFRGVYHAESILATMAYLGASIPDTYHYESPNILGGFRNTYRTIGVSKRCCPTCTKLLSLLTPHQHDARESGEPLTVLCSHQKIYPTSLPPLLPSDVAELLITWLEELLKDELVKLVKKKRRSTGISVKSATSQDSKEKSPEKAIGPVVSPILKPRALGKTPGGGNRFVRWCGKKTAEVGEQAQGTGLKGSE